ncbi:hypothetical protein Esti_005410 [Eimeria stiedai]
MLSSAQKAKAGEQTPPEPLERGEWRLSGLVLRVCPWSVFPPSENHLSDRSAEKGEENALSRRTFAMGRRGRPICDGMRGPRALLAALLLLLFFEAGLLMAAGETSVFGKGQLGAEGKQGASFSRPVLRDREGGDKKGEGLSEPRQESKREDPETPKKKKRKFAAPKLHSPKWIGKLLARVTGEAKKECLKVKQRGGIPEARFHSPLKHYGYLSFDEVAKSHTTYSALPLSLLNGFPVPIKIGQRDYTIQGDLDSVLLFLECFSAYEVKGSFLGEDGHWHSAQQAEYPVYVQLENTGPTAFGSAGQVLLRHSAERLLNSVAPLESLSGIMEKAVSSIPVLAPEARQALQTLAANWMYLKGVAQLASVVHLDAKELQEAWQEMSEKKSLKERAKVFMRLLRKSREDEVKEQWSGRQFVDLQKPVTLTLTMYPRPAHVVRATIRLSSNVVFVEEVLKAVGALSAGHDELSEMLSELVLGGGDS